MLPEVTPYQIRLLRLQAQSLQPFSYGFHAADPVRGLCGIQAQYTRSAAEAIGVRARGITAVDIEAARVHDRAIVRTWCHRGTLHFLAAEDFGWLMALMGPVFVRKSRRRLDELGLTEGICNRAVPAVDELLHSEGPMTRAEIAAELDRQGFPTAGQATYHLLRRAGMEAVVCYGPDREGDETYVAVRDWIKTGEALDENQATAKLTRRYLAGYGPAQPEDLTTWSGLSLSQVRKAFKSMESELVEVDLAGSAAWMLKDREDWLDVPGIRQTTVRLLPAYDPYLLGYRGRDWMVEAGYAKRIHPGGGLLRPTLLVDGHAAGIWWAKRHANTLAVTVEPFEEISDAMRAALGPETDRLGRFYGLETSLVVTR